MPGVKGRAQRGRRRSRRGVVREIEEQGGGPVGNDIVGRHRVLEADHVVGRGDAVAVVLVGPPPILSW